MRHELYPIIDDPATAHRLLSTCHSLWYGTPPLRQALSNLTVRLFGNGHNFVNLWPRSAGGGRHWYRIEVFPPWGNELYAADVYPSGTIYLEDMDRQRLPQLEQLLSRVVPAPTSLRLYARREADVVTEVFWISLNGRHVTGDSSRLELHRYVAPDQAGTTGPFQYIDGDFPAFMKRLWYGLEAGTVIATARAAFDNPVQMRLKAFPNERPTLTVNAPGYDEQQYLYWHPADATPHGEFGRQAIANQPRAGGYYVVDGRIAE